MLIFVVKKDKWALNPTAVAHTSDYLDLQSKKSEEKARQALVSPDYLFYYSIKL